MYIKSNFDKLLRLLTHSASTLCAPVHNWNRTLLIKKYLNFLTCLIVRYYPAYLARDAKSAFSFHRTHPAIHGPNTWTHLSELSFGFWGSLSAFPQFFCICFDGFSVTWRSRDHQRWHVVPWTKQVGESLSGRHTPSEGTHTHRCGLICMVIISSQRTLKSPTRGSTFFWVNPQLHR